MKRREFLGVLVSVAAWPFAARAQQNGVVQRIGVLTTLSEDDAEGRALLDAFRRRLSELGWVEGRNTQFEIRRTLGSPERAQTFAAEFANAKPGVVLAVGGTASVALLKQTSSVPAIFVTDTDPVAAGWVKSLARPGGNATGFVSFEATQGPKWLEMLKEIAPAMTRVFIFSSNNPQSRVLLPTVEAALPKLGITATNSYVHDVNGIERHFEAAASEPNAGVLVMASTIALVHRNLIVAQATKRRLPAVYTNSVFVRDGGLMSYGIDRKDQFRQAAGYVDRILRGEKPADLPVQTPTKFELVVNLNAAKNMGLAVPPRLLAVADEVVE